MEWLIYSNGFSFSNSVPNQLFVGLPTFFLSSSSHPLLCLSGSWALLCWSLWLLCTGVRTHLFFFIFSLRVCNLISMRIFSSSDDTIAKRQKVSTAQDILGREYNDKRKKGKNIYLRSISAVWIERGRAKRRQPKDRARVRPSSLLNGRWWWFFLVLLSRKKKPSLRLIDDETIERIQSAQQRRENKTSPGLWPIILRRQKASRPCQSVRFSFYFFVIFLRLAILLYYPPYCLCDMALIQVQEKSAPGTNFPTCVSCVERRCCAENAL